MSNSKVPLIWGWRKAVGGAAVVVIGGSVLAHYARSAIEGASPCNGHGPGYIAAEWPAGGKALRLDCNHLQGTLNANGPAPLTNVYDCIAVTVSKGNLSKNGRVWTYKGNKVITAGRGHITAVFLPHNIISTVTWQKCAEGKG